MPWAASCPSTRSIIGHPDDGEHLLGRGERQGAQPRSLAADEDNRLHYFVVVVDEGFVVVVAGAVDVVVRGCRRCGRRRHGTRRRRGAGGVVVVVATGWSTGQHLLQGE